MHTYLVYGGCLESEVPLPALRALDAARGRPTWHLHHVEGPVPDILAPELLGDDHVDAGVRVRLLRHARGVRLAYDDSGTFDLSGDGARIDWYPGHRATPDAVQLDVLGRVLPLALHLAGTLCLHGSAVEIDGRAIAFLAPKFHGKSTLAQALVRAGARLLGDDVVPVDARPEPVVRPGVAQVRLWRDSAARLAGDASAATDRYGKVAVHARSDDDEAPDRTPLAAVYLLAPVRAGASDAVRRTPLSPTAAAMALLPETRLAPLLGKGEGVHLLDRASRLAEAAGVYRLEVVRDFDRLGEVVARLREWHAAPTVVGTAVSA